MLAQRIGQILQYLAQHFVTTPMLKAPVYCLVVRVALRQHMPLDSRIQDPQHCFQHAPRVYRLAPCTPRRNVLLRKMPSYPFPLLFAQTHHNTPILPALSLLFNFEIDCSACLMLTIPHYSGGFRKSCQMTWITLGAIAQDSKTFLVLAYHNTFFALDLSDTMPNHAFLIELQIPLCRKHQAEAGASYRLVHYARAN